jgi:hypothetical protein
LFVSWGGLRGRFLAFLSQPSLKVVFANVRQRRGVLIPASRARGFFPALPLSDFNLYEGPQALILAKL